MAMRFNPFTNQWEEERPAGIPSTLEDVPSAPPVLSATTPIADPEMDAMLAQQERDRAAQTHQPELASLPPRQAPASPMLDVQPLTDQAGNRLQLAPPAATAGEGAPPAPAPRRLAGGGGGGGSAGGPPAGGHLTAGEAVAQGGLDTAQGEEEAAIRAGSDLEARKQGQLATMAAQQERDVAAAQKAWQERRAAAEQHLQAREDAASKVKIKDIFEGNPLAALLSAIASGIGARAAAITGTENTALRVAENAAKAYREKQQVHYEREMAGIAGEKDRLQFATMQAQADEAGLYRRMELDRTKLLQTYGADEARVNGDKLLGAFRTKYAAAKAEIATGLYNRGQAEMATAATIAEKRASAAQSYASAAKLRAEAAGGGGAGEGRAAAAQMQNARMAEHGGAQLHVIDEVEGKGIRLTKADLAKIQDNRTYMEQSKHSGVLATLAGRATGIVPRGPYDGLSPAKQKLASAYDVLAQKAAAIASPSHAADEIEAVRSAFALSPNDSPEAVAKKLEDARSIIGGAKALGGKFTERAAAGAAAERAAAGPRPMSTGEKAKWMADAQKHLEEHPDDAEVRAKLRALAAQRGR